MKQAPSKQANFIAVSAWVTNSRLENSRSKSRTVQGQEYATSLLKEFVNSVTAA